MQDAHDTLTPLPIFFPSIRGTSSTMSINSGSGASANSGNGASANKMVPLRRVTTAEEQDKKLQEVAQKYEKHFLREMVKAMRGTVSESQLIKTNQAETIFKEQLDEQYVEKWGDKGGIGLADMIYKQLLERYGPSLGISKGSAFTMKTLKSPSPDLVQKKLHLQFLRDLQKPNFQVLEVCAPWQGRILGVKSLDSSEYAVEMIHKNNLKSQLVFKGSVDQNLDRKEIQSGQRIGLLSPEARALHWTIDFDSN